MFARLGYYCSIDISTFAFGARFNNISREIVFARAASRGNEIRNTIAKRERERRKKAKENRFSHVAEMRRRVVAV